MATRRTASTAGGWTWPTRCRLGFWRDWHALARKINPDCYTVAEIWDNARHFLDDGGFSATMNYHGFSVPVKGFLIDEALAPSGAALQLNERRNEYPQAMQYALQNLIDSHDTDRLASMIVNAGQRPYAQAEPIRLRHRRLAAVRAGLRRAEAERPRATRAAARGVIADDVCWAANDLLRHRGGHVGRR